jgi:hypothetical protein
MKTDKNKQQDKAFLNDGFTFKGVKYKGFNLALIARLSEIESSFFTKQDIKGTLEYLFVASNDSDTIQDLIDDKSFNREVMKFGEQFSIADLKELELLIKEESDKVESMVVETRGDNGEKK